MKRHTLIAVAMTIAIASGVTADRAAAQAPLPPACVAERAGQVTCQASILCACRFFPAQATVTTPPGWRWDCGVLRPRCDPLPADGSSSRAVPLPGAVVIEQVQP